MNRLGQIDPAAVTGPVRDVFDGPLKGKHFNIFKSMGRSHAALQAYLGLSGAMGHSLLTPAEKEVVQLVVGEANNCGYCVAAHTAIGKMSGLTTEQTIEARRGAMADPKLNALTRFALAIDEKHGRVSDADLAAFRNAGYTDAHIAEVVAGYALAVYTNTFNHVNDTAPDFPTAPRI